MSYLYIILGAAVGAPLRYFVGSRFRPGLIGNFPVGTFVVNVTGCFLIGLLLAYAAEKGSLSREARLLLVTGFLGSYTTFSAFGWETYDLLKVSEPLTAAAYAGLSVVAGVLAVWLAATLVQKL
ncbi:fluoride efflux transporter CrcB [Tepidiforma sp.]|uniref:fluoride efflux transporter CrcB n=1 Tax=Tepidiforma sp. TaxID=2682230 RepID=UPI002ADDD014|nr:fluoride efflux transporter CrcB [Tepidiforma sp.]